MVGHYTGYKLHVHKVRPSMWSGGVLTDNNNNDNNDNDNDNEDKSGLHRLATDIKNHHLGLCLTANIGNTVIIYIISLL